MARTAESKAPGAELAPEVKAANPALNTPTAPVLKADTSIANADLITGKVPDVVHNPNEYLVASITDGVEGRAFNIGVQTFNRVFLPLTTATNPTFIVKKSPIKK